MNKENLEISLKYVQVALDTIEDMGAIAELRKNNEITEQDIQTLQKVRELLDEIINKGGEKN